MGERERGEGRCIDSMNKTLVSCDVCIREDMMEFGIRTTKLLVYCCLGMRRFFSQMNGDFVRV